MSWRVTIDIGSAFTDLLAYNEETGETTWIKVESTPTNFSRGFIDSIKRSGLDLKDVDYIIY